jgi:hypothetical protein
MRALALVVLASGCRLAVDPGLTFRECDLARYEDEFVDGTTLETLAERCWRFANLEPDPERVFVHDGDLIVQMLEDPNAAAVEWSDASQGPLAFQRLPGDFTVVARVESLDPVTTNHCLAADNRAGIVLRSVESPAEWAGLFVGYDPDPACDDAAAPPTHGLVRHSGTLETERVDDIAEDGDAYVVLCKASAAEGSLPPSCDADGNCPPWEQEAVDAVYADTNTFASLADGFLVAGAITTAVGVVLWVVNPRADPAPASGRTLRITF